MLWGLGGDLRRSGLAVAMLGSGEWSTCPVDADIVADGRFPDTVLLVVGCFADRSVALIKSSHSTSMVVVDEVSVGKSHLAGYVGTINRSAILRKLI